MKGFHILIAASLLLTAACGKSDKAAEGEAESGKVTAAVPDKVAEVTVVELQPSLFNHEIVSNGKAEAREKVDLNFSGGGELISNVFVKNGQRVAKGQKIAQLDVFKLQNQLEKNRTAVANAKLELQDVIIGQGYDPEHLDKVPDDVMKLARLRSGLEAAEVDLSSTKKDLANATLTSPISGVVANLKTSAHNMSGSDPVCTVINDASMKVEFSVLEGELSMIKPGDIVDVSPFSGGESTSGRVTEINPTVDENGMVKVWASVDGGRGLIDGMNVRVRVKRALEKALVVPKTAVVLRSGKQVVFTLQDGKAMWNYVTTGLENLDSYTVVDGLEPGMTVIATGNVNLAHEAPVKVIAEN